MTWQEGLKIRRHWVKRIQIRTLPRPEVVPFAHFQILTGAHLTALVALITSRRFGSCPFDTVSVRLNSAFLHDAIALAEHDDAGLPVLDLMFGDVGEAHDGEDVTSFSLEGSRAVEDDLARTGIAGDGVGLEAISVCHIAAQDALVRYEPAFLHQVGGDGQAAFVLQIAICDCGAVNLRF